VEVAAQLFDVCKPSIFGRGPEKVYDEKYRQARDLPVHCFAISDDIQSALIGTGSVVETVERLIQYRIRADMYKVTKGSLFFPFKLH
jgi:hypothetical protein